MEINRIRRPLIVWLAFLILGSMWMTPILPRVKAALPQSPSGHYWFDPQKFSGHTLTYSMTTAGSIHVQTPDDQGRTSTVNLSAYVNVSIGAPNEDMEYPLTLSIFNVEAEGFPKDFAPGLSNTMIHGRMSSRGAISHLETPDVISRIGLDSLDLFSGLFVPGPERETDFGPRWEVSFNRLHLGATRTRTIPVVASYAHQGAREWGNRRLEFVTNRTRGSASWLEGAGRTEVLEVGSSLFYVDPHTGRTAISSVSKITSIDIVEQRIGMVQTRNTLTTTLELADQPPVIVDPSDLGDFGTVGIDPVLTAPPESEEQMWLYQDPAGRFQIQLPGNWRSAHVNLGLRSTTIAAEHAPDTIYVHVLPLPNPGASSLTVARLALTTYQETRREFQLVDDLTPIELDGESAYLVRYSYENEGGNKVTEWATFARHGDRAYYVRYATENGGGQTTSQVTRLLAGFRYGPTPEGNVSSQLLAESLSSYHDPDGRFSILVPSLWPLIDRAQDGSTTTFSELGGAGYLTVFAQPGAASLSVWDIVNSWKVQSEQESGYELIHDLTPAPLAGHDGIFFEYHWSTNADTNLVRRLHATVVDDYLYAIALDYVAPDFESRRETFDRIFSSMTLKDALQSDRAVDENIVFSSRILTRYPGADGQTTSQWAAHVEVTIRVGEHEFTAVTDEQGYLSVTDLPRLEEVYLITHVRGPLFGFTRAGVNLDNLGFRPDASSVISTGTIILTMDEEFNIGIDFSRDE